MTKWSLSAIIVTNIYIGGLADVVLPGARPYAWLSG